MTTSESLRVVYVGDDTALSDLGETYLRRPSSFEMTTCSDPRVTFDIIRDFDIDCMISDYDMPAVIGAELLETVREDHGPPPLILLTGRGSEKVTSDTISASVTDYLQKQPSSEQRELLVNCIENSVLEYRATCRAERYETVLEVLGHPVYAVDECDRFEYVNDAFADHGGSEVAVAVGRTHDGFYVEDNGDGLPDDRSPEECFRAGGDEHRGGGLTRHRRPNF